MATPDIERRVKERRKEPSGPGIYDFDGGFPSGETVHHAFDDLDLIRAVQASMSMCG